MILLFLSILVPSINIINAFSTSFHPPPGNAPGNIIRGYVHQNKDLTQNVRFLLANSFDETAPDVHSSQLNSSNSSTNRVENENTVDNIEQLMETIDKLRIDSTMAGKRARMAEETVEALQRKIREAEANLSKREDSWQVETNKLLERLNVITSIIQNKEAEMKSSTESLVQEGKAREQQLKAEIAQWKESLRQAQLELDEQRIGEAELKDRLLKAEDHLEFEQMRFQKQTEDLENRITDKMAKLAQLEKEKIALEDIVDDQQSRIDQVEDNLQTQKIKFKEESRRLEEKVEESERILNLKRRQMYNRYRNIRKEMESLLNGTRNDARKEQDRLSKKISEKNKIIESLQSQIDSAKLAFQQVDQLQEELARQKEQFTKEQNTMESQFSEKLEERNRAIEELEKNIENKEADQRLSKLEIQEMEDRINEMRQEMAWRLEKAQNNAMAEKKQLKKEHEAQIVERNGVISNLQIELSDTKGEVKRLDGSLFDMTRQRNEKVDELRKLDMCVTEQNAKISQLVNNVMILEADARERDDKISTYESSYREMVKLSIKLTGKRLRNAGSKVGSLFRRVRKKM